MGLSWAGESWIPAGEVAFVPRKLGIGLTIADIAGQRRERTPLPDLRVVAVRLQGTIFKKCDMSAHKPESNKACAAGTCQHACAAPDKCPHAWTLRYSVNGRQKKTSFRDDKRR